MYFIDIEFFSFYRKIFNGIQRMSIIFERIGSVVVQVTLQTFLMKLMKIMTTSQIGLKRVYGWSYGHIGIVMSSKPKVKRTRRIMNPIVVDWASHFTLVVLSALITMRQDWYWYISGLSFSNTKFYLSMSLVKIDVG